jgi:hypothetical protein
LKNDREAEALVAIDFAKRFPYHLWITSWSEDDEHPLGFRYKFISTHSGPTGPIELVILLEEAGGMQAELNRIEVSAPAFERTVAIYVDGLSESGDLTFFALDLSKCRSVEDYKRVVEDAGWYQLAPP